MTLSMAEDFLAKAVDLFDGKIGTHPSRIGVGNRHSPSSQRL